MLPGFLCLAACQQGAPTPTLVLEPQLVTQHVQSDALFIGLSIVDTATVWLGGSGGTWARTTDAGATWSTGVVSGADSLQFRDVHGVDGSTAYLLSIGNGEQSRIYRTMDAGATWAAVFTNDEPRAFFDCFAFWDATHGIAFSDSFDGAFRIITTTDGENWSALPATSLPAATQGEGAFASSGTCVVADGDSTAWIGTGASDGGARVLRTMDRGTTWSVASTPIVRGASAGITSLAVRDGDHLAALGGDIAQPDSTTENVALSSDGGLSWTLAARTPFPGAVYSAAWVPGAPEPTLVAVGPGGVAITTDAAGTWTVLDTLNHWSVGFASPKRGWAVGPGGRITAIRTYR